MTDTVAITRLNRLGVYDLARMAECGGPESQDSAGAVFLTEIRNSVVELFESNLVDPDGEVEEYLISEIAAFSYSFEKSGLWAQFYDLEAYDEEPGNIGVRCADDMTAGAQACLAVIANRLVRALIDYALDED